MNKDNKKKKIRQLRTRASIVSKKRQIRLSVFRSGKHLYAALINDFEGKTIATVSDLKESKSPQELGHKLALLAKEKKITNVVFDRGRFAYHGKIKALAEDARKSGLVF